MTVSLETLLKRSTDRLGAVHPQIREYSLELIKRAYKEGIRVQISSGFRSNTEQANIYGQGRPSYVWNGKKYGRAGSIVSNAKPGSSVHNYGLAIDYFLVSEDGNNSIWVVNNQWRRVAAIAKSMGWEWGGDWASFRDYPHLQITGGLSIAQLATGKRPTIKPLSNVKPVVSNPWTKGYLDIGDNGPAIAQLQKDLNAAGANPPLAIDNNFGVAVKNRVITFQENNKLEADGIYGAASAAKMQTVLARLKEPVAKPSSNKNEEDEKLELNAANRKEIAAIFKTARERGVFSSTEHEKSIMDGSMTQSRLLYLNTLIAGAALVGGKRIK